MNAFDVFNDTSIEHKNKTIIDLFDCQKKYGQLLREYKEEFDYIVRSLKDLREERCNFYEVRLPQMKKILLEDKVAPDVGMDWLKELESAMERSFQMSERLMNDLIIKDMDEFRQEAENIIRGGR